MYHYVYCIENLVNGKVYVGKHSTDDLDDGYMGSGKLLTNAIKNYSVDNFRKHIIKMCESSEEAFDLERQLVDEQFVNDENTYNLVVGGAGIDSTRASILGKISARLNQSNPEFGKMISARNKQLWKLGVFRKPPSFTGLKHTVHTKKLIGSANSISQKGERNSQYGTRWMIDPKTKEVKKVKSSEMELFLSTGWIFGRKI